MVFKTNSMQITVLFCIVFAVLVLWYFIVRLFDMALIRQIIKRIKEKEYLTADQIKDAVSKFLENRALNRAHQIYIGAVVSLVGGNTLISFARGLLTIEQGNNRYSLELLYDNGLPPYIIAIALILITIVHLYFLYSRAKLYKADIISSAAAIINEEFSFKPNQEWFRVKSEKSIADLGASFDLKINFNYEYFEEALASTCRDNRISKVFAKDVDGFVKDFLRERESLVQSLGAAEVQDIEVIISDIRSLLTRKSYEGDEPSKVISSIDQIEKKLEVAIQGGKLSYGDYKYTKIHSALEAIRGKASNPWIRSISNQTFIVYGQGGCGKTHLLAKLVEARVAIGLPTVFFLGKLITDTDNPLSQILSNLDVHSRKEVFLKALEEYGEKHGRVLLVVDGINEGRGLSLWRNHLLSFINEFKPYKHISLIVTVRTNSSQNWFSKFIDNEGFPSYRHSGFEKNMAGAVEYMFKSFNVPLPSWPLYQREFTNPLLLTLYCRTHSGEKRPPIFEGRLDIIKNYIAHFNERLSESCKYSPQANVLQKVLSAIGAAILKTKGQWFIVRSEVEKIIINTPGAPRDKGFFIDALVDEGILNEYEYDGKKETDYSFGYDTIGAYLMAESIAKSSDLRTIPAYSESVIEALTDVVPLYRGKELFELVSETDFYDEYLEELFIKGLPSRSSITRGGANFLEKMIEEGDYQSLFQVIINTPFRKDLPVSVETLDDLFKNLPMVKLDAVWTQTISDSYELSDSLLSLAQWAWSASPTVLNNIKDELLRNVIHLLGWTLSTTYLELRDKACRGLINILKNNEKLLLDFIRLFSSVDDYYIRERVFAIAFGCCTGNAKKDFIAPIAQEVYDVVFKKGSAPEHILIRDYAKCTIDYANSVGCILDYDADKVKPPYGAKKNVFTPTEDILKYELSYDKEEDKKRVTAQNNILESMCTEYSSRGMYGDFGRYVFQAALDNWDENIEEISNYGIKMIFDEFGYDANVFKGFDGRHASWERHGNIIERIGKKYEWIALYRIAAILEDNHFGEPMAQDWYTAPIYHLRRFDPTILMNPDIRDYTMPLPKYQVPEYDLSSGGSDREWMMSWKKMPKPDCYIEYNDGKYKWICLNAYYTVASMSSIKGKYPTERELWSYVQAFFVDSIHRKELCELIDNEGLSGRDSSENPDASYSYYREYYWSESYKTQIEAQGYAEREYRAGRKYTQYKVQPSYLLYDISQYADASITSSKEMILPSPFVFRSLNLRFSIADGVWLAQDGTVACFDSYWVHGDHAGLFIRKDLLLQYLLKSNKGIVWPILMERMYKPGGTYWPRIQVGGFVWMDKKGKLHYKFRSYEPTNLDRKVEQLKSSICKILYRVKKKLVEKGMIKVSLKERLDMLSEIDDE